MKNTGDAQLKLQQIGARLAEINRRTMALRGSGPVLSDEASRELVTLQQERAQLLGEEDQLKQQLADSASGH